MPPKKGATKAKAPAKAAEEPPATITNTKGKEIATTAAAGRARRATTSAVSEAPVKKAPVKKAASKPAAAKPTANTGKKRGRPAKTEEDVAEEEPPKKRGRPSKSLSTTPAPDTATGKKRGRPAKGEAPAVSINEKAPPKKRGKPPKGGETTHVEAEDEAAAEQLEEELVDAVVNEAAEEPSKPISTVKRGRPAKGKKAVADTEDDTDIKNYWLMKAEQEDREETLKDGGVFNAKFTIDDLRERGGPEPWDGVRNAAACKNLREMKLGDLAFFYASGGKKGRVPGITGIMEIVKEHEPDPSVFDENSPFYVEKASMRGTVEKPRWSMVHVEFRKKLSKPVTLSELKKFAAEGSALSQMQEFTSARLSVSKVTEKEWNFIVNNLIEGYEDGDDGGETPLAVPAPPKTIPPSIFGGAALEQPAVNGQPEPFVLVRNTIESEDQATDAGSMPIESSTTFQANGVANSSRPTSRAGSKKPSSRAGSRAGSRPASRAGSLAPPKAEGRGRSRTPRAASAQPLTAVPEEKLALA